MKKILMAAALMTALLLQGCGTESTEPVNNEQTKDQDALVLSVTEDYGCEAVYTGISEVRDNMAVYDLMLEHVDLETDYGGSFVSAIGGVESVMKNDQGLRADWFYYVNGVCADVGVLDYTLTAGDVVWWDYHSWQSGMSSNAAVVGAYPEPFINGYAGRSGQSVILYAEGYEAVANELYKELTGFGGDVQKPRRLAENDSAVEKRTGPTMVIGDWQVLSGQAYLKALNEAGISGGNYTYYSESGVDLLEVDEQVGKHVSAGVGTVMAQGAGLGDANPLWLVTGTDDDGVNLVIDRMLTDPESLESCYSLAITEDGPIRLPMIGE